MLVDIQSVEEGKEGKGKTGESCEVRKGERWNRGGG